MKIRRTGETVEVIFTKGEEVANALAIQGDCPRCGMESEGCSGVRRRGSNLRVSCDTAAGRTMFGDYANLSDIQDPCGIARGVRMDQLDRNERRKPKNRRR